MDAGQQAAAVELCRRVICCYLARLSAEQVDVDIMRQRRGGRPESAKAFIRHQWNELAAMDPEAMQKLADDVQMAADAQTG